MRHKSVLAAVRGYVAVVAAALITLEEFTSKQTFGGAHGHVSNIPEPEIVSLMLAGLLLTSLVRRSRKSTYPMIRPYKA